MFGDPIPSEVWQERSTWLEQVEKSSSHPDASYLLSPQGTLITCDIQNAFCAGAWVSVIVLAHAAIDATIRDTEIGDYSANSKKLFAGDPDLEWLRLLRNKCVHVREDSADGPLPDRDMGDLDVYHDALEGSARRAVQLLFRTIYASPGV